jgi:hypothetical protein
MKPEIRMPRFRLLVVVLALAVPAAAHHGFGTFDLSRTVTFDNAVITRVELVNPHSWLYFDLTSADGGVERHRCEMRSAHVLRRSGWNESLFPIGGRMTLNASPDRADPNSCYLQTILFESGDRMDRYGQYVRAEGELREVRGPLTVPEGPRELRRPTGEPNLTGDWAPEQRVMADPRGVGGGLVPLGSLAAIDEGEPPVGRGAGGRGGAGGERPTYGGTTLTRVGEIAAERFQREDNPRFRCETTSILFDWTFDGPVNRIVQNADTIEIVYGQHGLRRTIHMNMDAHPADLDPTRAGHSIGRWEDDVLVVDTVRFLPGVLNAPVIHSGRLRVVERFSLDLETLALTRTYVAEDPLFLEGQYTGSDTVYPADVPYADDVCEEQGFIDYSEIVEPEE